MIYPSFSYYLMVSIPLWLLSVYQQTRESQKYFRVAFMNLISKLFYHILDLNMNIFVLDTQEFHSQARLNLLLNEALWWRKFSTRMSSWANTCLSYAGRHQLLQAIIFSMQTFCAQIFIFPKVVFRQIDQKCRMFLWSRQCKDLMKALIKWEQLCNPKNHGDLGLFNITQRNKVAVGKLLWALCNNKEKLWIRWVHQYYIKQN